MSSFFALFSFKSLLSSKEIRLAEAAKVCPYSKRSLERWLAVYKKGGEDALEPKSTEPKTQPRETPIWIKERVIKTRKETKKCAMKIYWQLKKEGLILDARTIGKILKGIPGVLTITSYPPSFLR